MIDSGDGDLTGSASFDDVWLGELPRMTLMVDDPQPLYPSRQADSAGRRDYRLERSTAGRNRTVHGLGQTGAG